MDAMNKANTKFIERLCNCKLNQIHKDQKSYSEKISELNLEN